MFKLISKTSAKWDRAQEFVLKKYSSTKSDRVEFGDTSCLIFPSGYERTGERDQVVVIGIVIDKSFFHSHLKHIF